MPVAEARGILGKDFIIGGKIIKALLKDYDMTGDEALDIYQTRKRDDYTVKLHQKLKELGLG